MCVNTGQKALQKSIGESSIALAVETMDKIDRNIYYTIEEFQAYCRGLVLQETIAKSNLEFEKLENLQEYIDEKNNEWISAQKAATTPLMQELLNNKLSEELREKIGFHEEKRGNKVFGEVFVTNKYGANIALTDKTSDYRQDDELWWEKAREDGLYVNDVKYDESSGIYSTTIAIRCNDQEGSFAGVVKVVLNIEETIDIIRNTKAVIKYNSAKFKLLDRNGKTIFDQSGELNFFEDISNCDFFKEIAGDRGYLRKKAEYEKEGKIELLAFARSQGHQDYNGLGWILTIEYGTTELFAPVVKLRNIILSTSLVLAILAVIIGLLISQHISRPLSRLKAAMDKIGKGDMDVHVDIKRNDEIGQLANSFNQMIEHRKQAEEALRISEGKLGAMLRAITDDIAVLDNDLNIIWTNDAARDIFGDDIVGRKCYEVYHQRNKPCEPYPCPTLQAFEDGNIHQYETHVTDKEGKSRHIHCIANVALRDKSGKPTGVLEICRDITERKRIEEALRVSERKYSELVQQSPDAVISLDNIGNFLSFNPAAERVSGFSAQEVIGKHFTRVGILDKKTIAKSQKELELILAGAERQLFDLVITRKDKSHVHMEANSRLIKQKGRKTWIQITLRDITERKRAEKKLRQSQKEAEDALRTGELILDTMPVGVVVVGRDKKIRRVNKAALRMMGCNYPQEIIGNICHKKICPAEVDKCPVIDLGNTVDNSEKVLLDHDGRGIPILKTVRPITLEGEDVYLEAFVDITEL
ncbi:MAG: PAS domain S-box protein, partial [Planctomycetota bacterium]